MDSKFQADFDKSQTQTSAQGSDGNQAKRRRAKGEAGEGSYICGCGKVYLSYPALYTHIKTKHDGVTPPNTTQPQTSSKSGRGRPKKGESANKAKEEEDKESHNENNDNQIAYGNLLNYLKILEMEYKYDDQGSDVSSIVSTIPDNFDLVARFPADALRPNDYGPVLQELESIVKTKNIGAEEIDEDTGLKKTNMNRIFAIFIYLIGRHLKEKFYREFVFFLMMYRRALNELGWKVRENVGQSFIPETKKEAEFCANNNGEYAPEISNDFITEKWPKYLPQYGLKGFKVLGTDIESTKNAVFLTQHFCNWLSHQGYTSSYLSINEEDNS
jgi:hypothetical protein